MSFITERYQIFRRKSGKWGLLGRTGWYHATGSDGELKVRVFETREKAIEFYGQKKLEELEERKAKKERNAEIDLLVEKFLQDTGDSGVIVHRDFVTKSGKKGFIEWNSGMTKRSLNCVTLFLDGQCVFTSGTLRKVVEYIITH